MFESVIGHIGNKKTLEKHIKDDELVHSYLFEGIEGIGKKLLALEFAKEILKVDNLASSADFKYITKAEGKKDIVVEQIRKEIIDDVYIAPSSGDKKVYIIDDAQNLNVAAQNALLKTLEEPPRYVVIILISNGITQFLPTIISRLNVMHFNGLSDDEINMYIKNQMNVTLEKRYIDYLNGSLGKAKKLIENGMLENLKEVDKLLECIKIKNVLESLKKAKNVNFNDSDLIDYFEYALFSNNFYNTVSIVEKAILRLKYNGNYDIVIDNMILKIIDNI